MSIGRGQRHTATAKATRSQLLDSNAQRSISSAGLNSMLRGANNLMRGLCLRDAFFLAHNHAKDSRPLKECSQPRARCGSAWTKPGEQHRLKFKKRVIQNKGDARQSKLDPLVTWCGCVMGRFCDFAWRACDCRLRMISLFSQVSSGRSI